MDEAMQNMLRPPERHKEIKAAKLKEQVTELQRLCERAYLILGERWNEHTDEDGYGPSSLMRDLEKAKNGMELKDNYLLIDALRQSLTELETKLKASNALARDLIKSKRHRMRAFNHDYPEHQDLIESLGGKDDG